MCAVNTMENCIQTIKKWVTENNLKMNDEKTKLMILKARQQLSKHSVSHLTVGDLQVFPTESVKSLGVWSDQSLSLRLQNNKTCKSSFFYLHNIKKIRKFLSADFTAMLIHAFISRRLDYCNKLYYGLPACQIVKLQRVQNAAAKLI